MAGRLDLDDPYFHTVQARAFHRPNRLPPEPAVPIARYCAHMERFGTELMRLFASALALSPDWFGGMIDRHFSILSMIHCAAQIFPLLPGQVRAGAHTDYGALTNLAQAPGGDGLQIKVHDGTWIDRPCRRTLGFELTPCGEPAAVRAPINRLFSSSKSRRACRSRRGRCARSRGTNPRRRLRAREGARDRWRLTLPIRPA
jgi:hypothetical protein